jgi:DNA-binding NarL/FixJ family response regulator
VSHVEPSIIHIVLAGGRRILREGLILLLEKHPDLTVVAEAEDASSAAKLVRTIPADVVILGESALATIGTEQIATVRRAKRDIKIVVTALNPPVQWVRGMIDAGASACVTKECTTDELVTAIRSACNGQLYLSPKLVHMLVTSQIQTNAHPTREKHLGPREREILRRVAEGKITKQIAGELGIGVKTVETHRRRLMTKLNAFSVAELTKHAIQQGLTSVEIHSDS